ncbi:hypothetical protein [Pseudomonas luteola]|uniref:hypothetical protein n=1 Tax=Pseudomonas luteola TaxID=47886 RepID=UPI0009147DE8|nr:hypothetical protein [Pseudomonas zeshuii]SHJ68839.1 hypothetical protein SAMN05216295_12259 [Pseudomonas zeshuii]
MTKNNQNSPKDQIRDLLKISTQNLFREADKILQEEQMTLGDYLAQKTANLDRYIIQEQSTNKLEYISGEVSVSLFEKDRFIFSFDFYFTNINKEWVKNSHSDAPKPLNLYFLEEDQMRIQRELKISYTYEKPCV